MQQDTIEKEIIQDKKLESTTDRISSLRKRADLSDIILEKEKNVVNKKKRIILSAATLVLMFLIFLIISKILNTTSEEVSNVKEEKVVLNDKKIIKKDVKSVDDTILVPDDSKKISETDLKFEEMVKKLKEEDNKESETIVNNIQQNDTPVIQPALQDREPKAVISSTLNTPTETIKEEKIVKKVIDTKPPKKVEKKVSMIQKSKEINKPIHRVVKTRSHHKRVPSFSNKSGYFIQVAATTTPKPKRSLVQSIYGSGFSYTTYPIYIKGRKFYKILIGPYKTRAAALRHIGKVKMNINPSAYIIHLR